jgi:pimeloyl-ACP methyl ester carboxylesterase
LADFVDQLEALTRRLELEKVDLVGFSMGAMVAQGYAAAHPQRVGALVLVSAVYDRSPGESEAARVRAKNLTKEAYAASIEEAIERWFTPGFLQNNPKTADKVRRCMQGNDLAAYAAAYDVFARADRELVRLVPKIEAPTLVMTGSEDRRSTPAMCVALATELPHGKSLIVKGRRHLLPLEVPDILTSVIGEFLSGAIGAPKTVASP